MKPAMRSANVDIEAKTPKVDNMVVVFENLNKEDKKAPVRVNFNSSLFGDTLEERKRVMEIIMRHQPRNLIFHIEENERNGETQVKMHKDLLKAFSGRQEAFEYIKDIEQKIGLLPDKELNQ